MNKTFEALIVLGMLSFFVGGIVWIATVTDLVWLLIRHAGSISLGGVAVAMTAAFLESLLTPREKTTN